MGLFLSRFDYVIDHISGNRNVFADILTRWTKGYRNERKLSTARVCSLVDTAHQVVPSTADIEWPRLESIRSAQENVFRRTR